MLTAELVSTASDEHEWLTLNTRAPVPTPRLLVARYTAPSVVLGCSQRPDDEMEQRAVDNGTGLVRRRAGGGAVLADDSLLGLSLLLPTDHPVSQLDSLAGYQWFGELWVQALATLGVDARLPAADLINSTKEQARQQDIDWACYGALGHGEVIADSARKLVGIAQVRTRHCVAMVSGLQLHKADWALLCRVMGKPAAMADTLAAANTDLAALGISDVGEATRDLINWFAVRASNHWPEAQLPAGPRNC